MGVDPQSLFRLHVHSCTHWQGPRNIPPPPPPHLGLCTRALLVSQERRHLFVTPYCDSYPSVQEVECRILGRSKTGQTVEIR